MYGTGDILREEVIKKTVVNDETLNALNAVIRATSSQKKADEMVFFFTNHQTNLGGKKYNYCLCQVIHVDRKS